MNNTSCPIGEHIVDELESISFGLYFHSRAHYVSANYYEDLDRCLTYVLSVCQAVVSISSGAVITSIGFSERHPVKVIAALCVTLFALTSTAITTVKDDVKHNPAEKTKLHNEAGLQLKELARRVDWYILQGKHAGITCKEMQIAYNDTIRQQSEVKENVIKSEDNTFWCVHTTLSPKMKELAEKHKKYIPKEGSCVFADIEMCRQLEHGMYILVYCYLTIISVFPVALPIVFVLKYFEFDVKEFIKCKKRVSNNSNESGETANNPVTSNSSNESGDTVNNPVTSNSSNESGDTVYNQVTSPSDSSQHSQRRRSPRVQNRPTSQTIVDSQK